MDKLLPYQPENYFKLDHMTTVSDEDLLKYGFHVEGNHENLFTIDESLLHIHKGKKNERLNIPFDASQSHPFQPFISSWETLGSNCWAVHGNFTKSGKPMLACDPHLAKFTSATWYPTRMSWNETEVVETESGPTLSSYRTYMAGHSVVGIPFFSYLKTPFIAGGVTSLNPDTQDLFLEDIKGDQYLSSDGTWKDLGVIHEVVKVRFGRDVHFDIKYTDNGVLMPKEILDKETKTFSIHLIPAMW